VDTNHRYEVEIQLGRTDEAHIVRTIEYWDLERKRYPQYEHSAVLVAEDITSRFLNVIALFNGAVPLIAIQLEAMRVADMIQLIFTTVVDELQRGLVDEDEEITEVTDRSYWEKRGTKETLAMADEMLGWIKAEIDPKLEFKYNKFYIGMAKDGRPHNFVTFTPKKDWVTLVVKVDRSDETDAQIDASGLDVMPYDQRWRNYRVRLQRTDLAKHRDLLVDLIRRAHGDTD